MSKSLEAFRTIGEVSDLLDVPKHVLRFWEARFPQIKPMKRGGGRRFYRPEDVALLRGIHHLLHQAGFTIKGVQKILREQGIEAVKTIAGDASAEPASAIPAPPTKAKPTRASQKLPQAMRERLAAIVAELEACLAIARGDAPAVAAVRPTGPSSRRRA